MSSIGDLIYIRGEDVEIYRRSSSGVDEFNRPKYTWSLQATEKAIVQGFKWGMGLGELVTYAGEINADDQVGFFKSDSVVQDDDQVVWAGYRYDVKAVCLRRLGGAMSYKVCVLKRLVE